MTKKTKVIIGIFSALAVTAIVVAVGHKNYGWFSKDEKKHEAAAGTDWNKVFDKMNKDKSKGK